MNQVLLAKSFFCLVVLVGFACAMPHLMDYKPNDFDRRKEPATQNELEFYNMLQKINEDAKRSRNIACQIFLPGSNCDNLQIPGSSRDDSHWRDAGPGKR